jgi:predicted Rossmann fold nucleotide-binding protein DprA/Smf involved in DNA uptake
MAIMEIEKKIFLHDLPVYKTLEKNVYKRIAKEQAKGDSSKKNIYIHKWSKKPKKYCIDDLLLPEWIFAKGSLSSQIGKQTCVGVCGTLSPTYFGFVLAEGIANKVSKLGATVISGGVPGIDTAAHIGALGPNDGSSIAVLPNPVKYGTVGNQDMPSFLSKSIIAKGCLISEYNTHVIEGSDFFKERLLKRDRIISGLSDLLIVVESSKDSATVDTAKRAWFQGKTILAIEWENIDSLRHRPKCEGNKQLIDLGIAKPLYNNQLEMLDNILPSLITFNHQKIENY